MNTGESTAKIMKNQEYCTHSFNHLSSFLFSLGLPPNNQKQLPPSPPGQRIQNFNQPIRNNLNNNNKTTENIPSIMDGVIPNPRAPPRGMGPRFSGGRDGPPRGRGGYNQRGGPGPRPRWDGPTPQPQPMGQVRKTVSSFFLEISLLNIVCLHGQNVLLLLSF